MAASISEQIAELDVMLTRAVEQRRTARAEHRTEAEAVLTRGIDRLLLTRHRLTTQKVPT